MNHSGLLSGLSPRLSLCARTLLLLTGHYLTNMTKGLQGPQACNAMRQCHATGPGSPLSAVGSCKPLS